MRLKALLLVLLALTLAGPVLAQDRTATNATAISATLIAGNGQTAQLAEGKIRMAKIKLRRTCPADQDRCACADTGTSACCTKDQRCACSPTAVCR